MSQTNSIPRLRRFWFAAALSAGLVWASAAPAQQIGSRADRSLPIEIEADSLEVQQNKQLAIFVGNVNAIQGSLRLRAEALTVHYASGQQAEPGAGQSIRKIDALGKVFFSTEAETVEGDEGVYDVSAGIITLKGDVVLTRGESVIRGDRVVLNLVTGMSTVESGEGRTEGGGRVRGLFVPQQN